jgi:hypothetical protein
MCPYFKPSNSNCTLSELYKDGDQRELVCKSREAWKQCGNYEAKQNGTNYQNKW